MNSTNSDIAHFKCDDVASLVAEVLERVPAAVLVADRAGRVVAANRRQEELAGKGRGSLRGKHVRELPFLKTLPWDRWLASSASPSVAEQTVVVGEIKTQLRPISDAGDLTGLLIISDSVRDDQAYLEFFPESVAVVDSSRRVAAASRVFRKVMRLEDHGIFSPTCRDALCKDEWPCSVCVVTAALEGETMGRKVIRVHHTASRGTLTVVASPIQDVGESTQAAIVWLPHHSPGGRDRSGLSEDDQAFAQAKAAMELRNIALSACHVSVYVVDRHGQIVDFLGAPLPAVTNPTEVASLEQVLGGEGASVVRTLVKDGKAFSGRIRPSLPRTMVVPVSFSEGGDGAVVCIRAEDELREKFQRPDCTLQRLACFAKLGAALAHELNNSLNAISHRVDCLRIELSEGMDVTRAEAEVALLKEHVGRMVAATTELREIASLTQEEPSPVDVNAVLERAVASSKAFVSKSGVSVEKRLAPDVPKIMGWPSELERCFRQIVDNAVEAMAGEGHLVLMTRWAREQSMVQVSIMDSGEGIPPAYLRRVCEPFFTTRKCRSALGLGLSFAYYTVLRHGGELHVESVPHHGTTVTVSLPAGTSSGGEVSGSTASWEEQSRKCGQELR